MNTYIVWEGIGKVFPPLPLFYFVSKSYMSNYIVPTGIKAPWRMFVNNWERAGGRKMSTKGTQLLSPYGCYCRFIA